MEKSKVKKILAGLCVTGLVAGASLTSLPAIAASG